MIGMGLNIDCANLSALEYETLKGYLQRAQPAMIVCMDGHARALELARLLPSTQVIFRRYLPDDIWQTMSPQDWITAHVGYGGQPPNLWYYALNEPPLNSTVIAWLETVARLCLARAWRVVLGNFSVGVPEPSQWQNARALLSLISANPNRLMLGLHEYWPTYAPHEFQQQIEPPHSWPTVAEIARPWILGRFRHLLDYCKSAGIKTPRIAITEWGTDRIDAVSAWQTQTPGYYQRTGYKVAARAWSAWPRDSLSVGRYAGAMAKWAWRNFYAMHPEIAGVAWFCAGGQGDWRTYYNVLDEPEFLASVEKGFEMSTQTATYEIRNTGTRVQKARLIGVSALNLRSIPSTTNNSPVGRLKQGDVFEYYADSDARNFVAGAEDLRWRRHVNGNWFAIVTDRESDMLQPVNDQKQALIDALNDAANALDAARAIANALPD